MAKPALSHWIKRIRAAERAGDLLVAHDLAGRGLADHPDSIELRYLATRSLARTGACTRAAALYRKFGLDKEAGLDIAALGARIAKDAALNSMRGRSEALRGAAAEYARLYRKARDHYPAVNAASLYLLAGEHELARRYATRALETAASARLGDRLDSYYRWATEAEAALVLGDAAAARQALQRARRYLGQNFDAAATTRKQLRLVCEATGQSPDILEAIRTPAVLHYHGPVPPSARNRRGARGGDERAAAELAVLVRDCNVRYAYGSLTAGDEIMCAESLLEAGAELHVVLPFNQSEFVDTNVHIAGSGWVRRFDACLERATSVTLATADSFQGDDRLFGYACRLGMGMAILRADYLDADVVHLGLQPAGVDPDPIGHEQNIAAWTAGGRPVHLMNAKRPREPGDRRGGRARRRQAVPPRVPRALLFGDIKGYSKVPDALIPAFQKRMMGPIADALDRYDRHVLYRNSWGDAIYAVIDDPVVAAECCLAIQQAATSADPARYGLPPELSLRLAAHFGPVYQIHDPVRGEPNFFGAHTTLAARMEPVTAPGEVYVTEAMAASIAMARAPHLRAESVGVVPMAKSYGAVRMYRLDGGGRKAFRRNRTNGDAGRDRR